MANETAPDTQIPGGPAETPSDDTIQIEAAEALARELMGPGDDADDEDAGAGEGETPDEAAEAAPDGKPDDKGKDEAADKDDEADELAALEARMVQRRQQQAAQERARRESEAQITARVAQAKTEGETAARDELVNRLRRDPLGVLDDLGIDAREHYVTLRDHAANPGRRQPAGTPYAGRGPQDFNAAVSAEVQRQLEALGVRPPAAAGQPRPAAERQPPGAEEQQSAAELAFAEISGNVDRFPLLSDLSPQERVRYGVAVATKRIEEGRAGDNDLEEVAQEVEDLLVKRHQRQTARVAKRGNGAAQAGGTGGGGQSQGTGRAQPQAAGAVKRPTTLTPDLVSSRAQPKPHPDGIEPEEDRIAAATRIARQARREQQRSSS